MSPMISMRRPSLLIVATVVASFVRSIVNVERELTQHSGLSKQTALSAKRFQNAPVKKIPTRSRFFFFTLLAMMAITYLGFGLNLAMDLRKFGRFLPVA